MVHKKIYLKDGFPLAYHITKIQLLEMKGKVYVLQLSALVSTEF
jgi:hypothetical protein